MRAVNSILVAAGNLRQQLGDDPDWDEAKIVLRSINDVNLAKFLVEDLPLFRGITSDLFPGVELPTADYGVLPACLAAICDAGVEVAPGNVIRLEYKPEYVSKTIQLYEMVLVRHGVMVVGQVSPNTDYSDLYFYILRLHCFADLLGKDRHYPQPRQGNDQSE